MSRRRAAHVVLLISAVLVSFAPAVPVAAQEPAGPAVVVSQVYGGGGNSGALYTHDFIELFNRGDAPASLAGWSVQYASAAGTTWQVTGLTGTLAPGQHYLVQQAAGAAGSQPLPAPDATGGTAMAAGSGKVALVDSTTALSGGCPAATVDLVGYGSTASCFEGTGPTPTLSNPVSAVRVDAGCRDTGDNATDFVTANPPTPRNSPAPPAPCDGGGDPGEPAVAVTCPDSPVPGFAVSTTEGYEARRGLTATTDGTVTGFQVAVTPQPAAGGISVTDVAPGATATATLVVGADVPPGVYTAVVTASAAGGGSGSCTALIEVMPLVAIGEVQGAIADGQTSFTSPLLGDRVAVRAVVTQLTRESNGNRGFFLQEPADRTDGDPRSSDGVFVFNSGFTTVRTEAEGPARQQVGNNWPVRVGDEVVLRGEVGQFFGMTQFSGSSAFIWDVTGTGRDVDETVAVTQVDPPDAEAASLVYFRRHLGMQLAVPAGSLVVDGRDVFGGSDAEVWAIRGDHPVARRANPYARRVFRDVHPLDNQPATGFDDGNGYRFVLGSFGIKGSADDPAAVLAPARTFDTITAANRGGVYLSFGKYTINVVDQLALGNGADPAANDPVRPAHRPRQLALASYNVENLYDFRDDPGDGCDFAGNPGCFADGASVTPPFDYVPESEAAYRDRLARIAAQIRLDLHSPDVVMVQETESQDICRVTGAVLDCTAGDGAPDSLQELALVIAGQGGPRYLAAFDADSADLRGITTAFLYRTDRVELLPAGAGVLGPEPGIDYPGAPLPFTADVQNPKGFNAALPADVAATCSGSGPTECDGRNVYSRGPQVGLFRIWRDRIGFSSWTDVYLVANHFSSGPEDRVRQRTEQATYNARLAGAILADDPAARVLIGGDLNVFPRPDDPYPPGTPIPGIGSGPSDQLRGLYESPMTNLYDGMLADHPAASYSFGFEGQAQTLDQLWASPALLADLVDVRSAKINVDWPSDATGQPAPYGRFGVADHDPEAARFGAAATFPKTAALLDLLVDRGELRAGAAATIQAMLDAAEELESRGRHRAADLVLTTAVLTIRLLDLLHQLSPAAAGGLIAEVTQLRG